MNFFKKIVKTPGPNTRPPPTGESFLPGNQNLETPTPKFWGKNVWGHLGSSREFSWDHFKPSLSLLELVIWILEGI